MIKQFYWNHRYETPGQSLSEINGKDGVIHIPLNPGLGPHNKIQFSAIFRARFQLLPYNYNNYV